MCKCVKDRVIEALRGKWEADGAGKLDEIMGQDAEMNEEVMNEEVVDERPPVCPTYQHYYSKRAKKCILKPQCRQWCSNG